MPMAHDAVSILHVALVAAFLPLCACGARTGLSPGPPVDGGHDASRPNC